jgi:hypothetical protein
MILRIPEYTRKKITCHHLRGREVLDTIIPLFSLRFLCCGEKRTDELVKKYFKMLVTLTLPWGAPNTHEDMCYDTKHDTCQSSLLDHQAVGNCTNNNLLLLKFPVDLWRIYEMHPLFIKYVIFTFISMVFCLTLLPIASFCLAPKEGGGGHRKSTPECLIPILFYIVV